MGIFDKLFRKKKAKAQKIERASSIPSSTNSKKKEIAPEEITAGERKNTGPGWTIPEWTIAEQPIKLYRNPMGRAFKTLFDFIKKNFYDKGFCIEDLPDVNEAWVKEVEQTMSPTFGLGPSADEQAKIEVLMKMFRVGLLKYKRGPFSSIEKILFKLTEEGKKAKVIFGD
jgi:hypothetical protein